MPTPEGGARAIIDRKLNAAGCAVRGLVQLNLSMSSGVAVRDFPTTSRLADYMLFIDRKAASIVEA